mgnify:CR=1 FL=1
MHGGLDVAQRGLKLGDESTSDLGTLSCFSGEDRASLEPMREWMATAHCKEAKYKLSEEDLANGERIAKCPSCSLRIRVVVPGDAVAAPAAS